MEMVRLRIGKTPVPRKIRNQTLSDQEYDEYARLAGQMTKKALNGYINSPHWRMVPDSGKEIAIDHAFEASRHGAANVMMFRHRDIPNNATLQKRDKK